MTKVHFYCRGEIVDPVDLPHVPRLGEHVVTPRGTRCVVEDIITTLPQPLYMDTTTTVFLKEVR